MPNAAIALVPAATAPANESGAAPGEIRPSSAWALLASGRAILIDVRTADERATYGFVPDSVAIPWTDEDYVTPNARFLDDLQRSAPKDRALLFICRSGRRSASAAEQAAQTGYGEVFNVLEGFNGWRSRGLPWSAQA